MKQTTRLRFSLLLLLLILSLSLLGGCRLAAIREINREELFDLEIGKAEDQIDLFQLSGIPMHQKTRLFMRDGIFYVANGPSNKVMEFTSYGDLLSLFYDPDNNPQPVLLQTQKQSNTISNRRAHAYPFTQIGEIAVTRNRTLLAEDQLGEERAIFDDDLGVSLNRVVLRFDARGQLIDYLGQEGVGGTPFPYIDGLYVNSRDEIVVVCKTMHRWLVFWYRPNGDLLYHVEISLDRLPVPKDEKVIPILETVMPDSSERRVFLKLNYYQETVDPQTGAAYGINAVASRIYWLDLATGKYDGFVTIPKNKQQVAGNNLFDRKEIEYLYEFVGTAPGNFLYLLSREDNDRIQLLIMNTDGRVIRRRYLHVDEESIVYKTFTVSPEGILCALLGYEDQAKIVWWRSDKLLGRG